MAKYDTFYKRLLAGIIDGIIFLPFSFVDRLVENTESKSLFLTWSIFYTLCWTLYVVIGHGKYGQTIGKRLMNIQVLDKGEEIRIGYKRAFLRESVWFFTAILAIIYFIVATSANPVINEQLRETYFENFIGRTTAIWFLLELVTTLTNSKRRALHDFIAGSVVVDILELKREELYEKQDALAASLQNK